MTKRKLKTCAFRNRGLVFPHDCFNLSDANDGPPPSVPFRTASYKHRLPLVEFYLFTMVNAVGNCRLGSSQSRSNCFGKDWWDRGVLYAVTNVSIKDYFSNRRKVRVRTRLHALMREEVFNFVDGQRSTMTFTKPSTRKPPQRAPGITVASRFRM